MTRSSGSRSDAEGEDVAVAGGGVDVLDHVLTPAPGEEIGVVARPAPSSRLAAPFPWRTLPSVLPFPLITPSPVSVRFSTFAREGIAHRSQDGIDSAVRRLLDRVRGVVHHVDVVARRRPP